MHRCALAKGNSVIQRSGHLKLCLCRTAVHLCALGVQEGVALDLPLEDGCDCTDDEVHDHTYQDDWTGGGPLARVELGDGCTKAPTGASMEGLGWQEGQGLQVAKQLHTGTSRTGLLVQATHQPRQTLRSGLTMQSQGKV